MSARLPSALPEHPGIAGAGSAHEKGSTTFHPVRAMQRPYLSSRMSPVPHFQEILRRLALRDDRYIEAVLGDERENMLASSLDPKAHALVQLGALIALDAAAASYQCTVDEAIRAGATPGELVGALIAVMPATGVPRVMSAAPKLGLALGYDLDEALETLSREEEP